MKIPVYRPYLTGKEKDYVLNCIETSWISSRGEYVSKFEAEFERFVNVRHATSVCNGTVALHLALVALGLGPGDEVIVPTLTYIASANAIVHAGAKPIFVDCLPGTWQIDPEDVQRKITSQTKAVMAVHLYGASCDLTRLLTICDQHGLYLIEDCAEAFGTYCGDRHVGTFGDIATFSFFGNKTITTGEGGMVITNNPELFAKAFHLKTQGVSPTLEYWHDAIGYNYRMTNICAAIGLAQLEHAGEILKQKAQIASWYSDGLSQLPLTSQSVPADCRHSWWMYSVLTLNADDRAALRSTMRVAGVETRPVFHPIHGMPPYGSHDHFPVSEDISSRGINLPSYPGLTEGDVSAICDVIHSHYRPQLNSKVRKLREPRSRAHK